MNTENPISFEPDKPNRADAVRNRHLLLTTAERLFESQGVEAVTMSAVAKEAGVGKGTLYRNFTDKAELCVALLDAEMREFQQQTLEHIHDCTDTRGCLLWFLASAATYVVSHSDLLREAANHGGIDMLQHPAHIWWRQTIVGLLGRIEITGDASYIADILYVLLDVQTIRFQHCVQNYDLERIVAGLHMTLERLVGNED